MGEYFSERHAFLQLFGMMDLSGTVESRWQKEKQISNDFEFAGVDDNMCDFVFPYVFSDCPE
jgi:hypothetical protein